MRAFFHSPYVCLLLVIGLLASVTPVMKAVFTKDQVDPIMVAALRTIIPFAVLFPIAACRNRVVLMSLRRRDLKELSALGVLGIGSYLVAATGLSYTTVTHYVLIYSLLPGCTAILMAVLKHPALDDVNDNRNCTVVSWVHRGGYNERGTGNRVGGGGGRCARAALYGDVGVASRGEPSDYEACGDAHRAYRDVGSTSLVMIGAAWSGMKPGLSTLSLSTWIALSYIGLATVAVFLLRAHALKTLPPTTVASFHNLIPVCTLLIADLWSGGEPLQEGHVLRGGNYSHRTRSAASCPHESWPRYRERIYAHSHCRSCGSVWSPA